MRTPSLILDEYTRALLRDKPSELDASYTLIRKVHSVLYNGLSKELKEDVLDYMEVYLTCIRLSDFYGKLDAFAKINILLYFKHKPTII